MNIQTGKYQHYKGQYYQVLSVARHSESLEEYVVYKALYTSPEFGSQAIWVRPLKMFIENVNLNGQSLPRFKFISTDSA